MRALLPLLALTGCALLDPPDSPRVCTEEFRMYHVQVVDEAGRPLDGLVTSALLVRTGEVLTTQDATPPGSRFGYLVATDEHRALVREDGDTVRFSAEGEGVEAGATFEFYDDGCHLVKRSGPEQVTAGPTNG